MQHVLVVLPDADGEDIPPLGLEPVAEPYEVNLWRDDRLILWELLADGWQWDNVTNGPDRAIVIDPGTGWFNDGGTQPMPIGPLLPDVPDRRIYAAMGPGPASTFTTYPYLIWVLPIDMENAISVRVKKKIPKGLRAVGENPVDPDISNQPHP
jgi:hypothetical protein